MSYDAVRNSRPRRLSAPTLDGAAPRLRKESHVPLYFQLVIILENRIETGGYKPGQRFPSEQELCDEFGVSRAVVRPALEILEREGRVERIKGRGTFVGAAKAIYELSGLASVARTCLTNDARLSVLEVRSDPEGNRETQLLHAKAGDAISVMAVLSIADVPTTLFCSILSTNHIKWARDLSAGDVLPVSELETGLQPGVGHCVIETTWASDFEAECLGIPVGTSIFAAHCTEVAKFSEAPTLQNVELSWVVCRADALRLNVHLGVPEEAGNRLDRLPTMTSIL